MPIAGEHHLRFGDHRLRRVVMLIRKLLILGLLDWLFCSSILLRQVATPHLVMLVIRLLHGGMGVPRLRNRTGSLRRNPLAGGIESSRNSRRNKAAL